MTISKTLDPRSYHTSADQHVIPLNDLKEHSHEDRKCKCKASIDVQDNGVAVVVHNSYDGREFFEQEGAYSE